MMAAPLGAVRRDGQTAPFLDGAAEGRFLLRRCRDCRGSNGPQEATCPRCGSVASDWVAARGEADLVSWSVVHGRDAGGAFGPRSIVAIAQLDEGPWWWSQLVGARPEQLYTGRRLVIDFEAADGGESLPVFRLA